MEGTMTGERHSRRHVLQRGIGLAAVGVAGCSSLNPVDGTGRATTIQETSVSGDSLIVDLHEEHEVTKLNLIGPSGSIFRSTPVAEGTTTAEIGLFDYDQGWHYTSGEHSLAAVSEEGQEIESRIVPLEPELELTNVEQYTGGRPTPSNRGNLLVTVENKGTGPTWIFNMGYEDAPNPPANNVRTNEYVRMNPGLNLQKPKAEKDTILSPGDSAAFLGTRSPFLLSEDGHCDNMAIDLTVIIFSGVGDNQRERLHATLNGELLEANFRGTCGDIQVRIQEEDGSNE